METVKRRLKRLTSSRNLYLLLFLIVVVVVLSIINPLYISMDNIKNIMYSVSVSGVLMVGIATLLISGNMDLSAGSVGCFAAIIGVFLINAGCPWGIAVIAAMAVGGLCGLLNAVMAYKFGIMPFIGTLGISYVWSGISGIITNEANINLTNESFFKFGSTKIGDIPLAFLYVIILCIVYGIILKHTKFGRTVYMCGGNKHAARLAGIKSERVGTIMMINCSALAALAGMLLASRMHVINANNLQDTSTMSAITAALLGGIAFAGGAGNMFGAFLGIVLLNSFKNGIDIIGCNEYVQVVFNGLLLCAAMIVDYFNQMADKKKLKRTNDVEMNQM